ncbi:MAG: hypothetical protein ACOCU0_01285 [Bacillota bacterium]
MGFQWTSRKPNKGKATLYESNITLNKSASTHFEHAYNVLLGLDRETKRIAIKPVTKQEYERGIIPEEKRHKITVRSSYARVSNKRFMEEVATVANLDLHENNAIKFNTMWSDEDDALIIDLTQKGETLR